MILKIFHTWDGWLRHQPIRWQSRSRVLEASAVTCVTPSELHHEGSGGRRKSLGDSRQALKRSSGQEQFTTWYQGFHFITVRPSTLCQTPLSDLTSLPPFPGNLNPLPWNHCPQEVEASFLTEQSQLIVLWAQIHSFPKFYQLPLCLFLLFPLTPQDTRKPRGEWGGGAECHSQTSSANCTIWGAQESPRARKTSLGC